MNIKVLCVTDCCDRPETEMFIGLKKMGIDIEVFCNPNGDYYSLLQASDVLIKPLILKGRFDKVGIKFIRDQIKLKSYDIFHAFNPRALACGLRASKGLSIKIACYRGIIGNVSYFNPESWLTFLNPRVSKIICVADEIRHYFLQLNFMGIGISPSKVVRVYKGHKLEWYQDKPVDISMFGIPKDAFVVCFTGRDRQRKGIHVLIDSANYLPENTKIHYLLVGNLEKNLEIKEQISNSPYKNNFHFAGFRKDAPSIAAACNTLILPSIEREGLPRAVIEAMAYKTAPIVTDVGGMPELVEHDKSGLVIPRENPKAIADAMMTLYKDAEKCESLGRAAQQRIDKDFNHATTIKETIDIYKQLVA